MSKNKLKIFFSLVIFSAVFANLSSAQDQVTYYHAHYLKAFCKYNDQQNKFELILAENAQTTTTFDEMSECVLFLNQIEKDHCAATRSCSLVKATENLKI